MSTQKKRGLGRGLDALFGPTNPTQQSTPMSEMAEVAITDIIPNPLQPRRDFDEEALQELATSIAELGVIQPITLKRRDDGKYIIISGERRWRASQIAGLEVLPAYIRDVEDEDLHAMALVENIQRENLNAIEIALGMQRLVEECGLTQEAMADKVGKKRSTVSNYMRLLNLPDQVQLALKEGIITMGHAKAIAGVEADKQLRVLNRCINKSLSVRQAEELARKIAQGPVATAATDEEYPDSYLRLVELLEPYFSQSISIKRSKSGGGKIVIDFSDDEQIENIISRLQNR